VRELDERASRLWARVIAPLGLFALSLGVRALPAQEILIEGRTFFLGYDAYYHMRRIFYSVVHFLDSSIRYSWNGLPSGFLRCSEPRRWS